MFPKKKKKKKRKPPDHTAKKLIAVSRCSYHLDILTHSLF